MADPAARARFVWHELMTTDTKAAGNFFTKIVGWKTRVWPQQPDHPFTKAMTAGQKYVASRTLTEPLPWENSTLLHGDVADAVAKVKADSDVDITVLGSGELIRSLLPHDLIDELTLVTNPIVLGEGTRLFPARGSELKLDLAECIPTSTGAVIAVYHPVR